MYLTDDTYSYINPRSIPGNGHWVFVITNGSTNYNRIAIQLDRSKYSEVDVYSLNGTNSYILNAHLSINRLENFKVEHDSSLIVVAYSDKYTDMLQITMYLNYFKEEQDKELDPVLLSLLFISGIFLLLIIVWIVHYCRIKIRKRKARLNEKDSSYQVLTNESSILEDHKSKNTIQ